jgi:pimeloyl-ACP methyl ester carboxylesterase
LRKINKFDLFEEKYALINWSTKKIILMRKIGLIFSVFFSFHLFSQEYKIKLNPSIGKFKEVEYEMWLPENVKNIKGIILHQHGCGESAFKSGRNAFKDPQWRALAKKWDFALMGSSYESAKDCFDWINPEEGSYSTFIKGIAEIANLSNHKEIKEVPWILWGHSGGGHWSYKMVLQHPEKILCAVLKSPAWTDTSSLGLQVPILCLLGIQESYDVYSSLVWFPAISAMKYRIIKNAPVCIAPDPTAGHESADSRMLAISFIDEILLLRSAEGTTKIDKRNQCFIDLDNFKLTKPLTDSAYKDRGNWFPDKQFAAKWSEFVKTGKVTDRTPPLKAPFNVTTRTDGTKTIIEWKADADIESGFSGFRIYRNDTLINGDFYASQWDFKTDYHDNPIMTYDKFEYTDSNTTKKRAYKYEVSIVNQAGLESVKSIGIFSKN